MTAETRTFQLNKLVRDGVYESMVELGQKPEHTILSGMDLLLALADKLREELSEGELPDVQQAFTSFEAAFLEHLQQLGIDQAQLEQEVAKKLAKVGGFGGGHYVGQLTLDENDEWCKYYAADPERFPEVT